jgi:gamma-glutamyltranspeptidase/glutathione hydrolase
MPLSRGTITSIVCSLLSVVILLAVSCAPRAATQKPVTAAPPPAPLDTTYKPSVPLTASKGMVVSANKLASDVGRSVLEKGGNAMDAAVATLAALNVVEPHASGLGGGGFLLYYDAAHDSFSVIDYRECAPSRMNRTVFFQPTDTLHLVQRSGATSVLVPGAAAGWQTMHTRFATRPLADLFAPAISLADTGYPVSEKQSGMILDHLSDLQADSNLSRVFLRDSLPLAPGAKLSQPKLAETLKFLSSTRLENFYYPPISTAVVNTVKPRGGFLRTDDLMSYKVHDRTPVRAMYHGYEIITLPPPSKGGTELIEILKLIEPLDLKADGYLSAAYIQALAMASRQALKDGESWIGDPDFSPAPVKALLSDEWIAESRTRLKVDSIPERMTTMDSLRAYKMGNTTHLVVVDSADNMVSLTQSINYFFGSGLMVPELGLLLNNHMADFGADTTSVRAIASRHRPPSDMAATIVRKDGKPVLVIGSPGGSRIAPTLAQVLVDVLDFGMPLNKALDAPRFFPAGKRLFVETRIAKPTIDALAARGWKIIPVGAADAFFGGVHAIAVDGASHSFTGAADPRRDGAPAGY